jgi:nicotinamidase-related amidase
VARALVIVDIQNDYFVGGAHPLEGPEAAAASARRLLAGFRAAGDPVFHIRHVWDEEDATFMRPGTEGVKINGRVEPVEGEGSSRRSIRTASAIPHSNLSFARPG